MGRACLNIHTHRIISAIPYHVCPLAPRAEGQPHALPRLCPHPGSLPHSPNFRYFEISKWCLRRGFRRGALPVSRMFISHSSTDNAPAIAPRDWLVGEGWDDLFLDLDPERGSSMANVGRARFTRVRADARPYCS